MRSRGPFVLTSLLTLALSLLIGLLSAGPAAAARGQIAMIQDGVALAHDPAGTLQTFRKLGAGYVRVIVPWSYIAPDPTATHRPDFDATDPAAYPAANWVEWDAVVRDAQMYGITVDFTVTAGAPRWAEGPGIPRQIIGNLNRGWKPSSKEFGKFMLALATRYDGSYTPEGQSTPLPKVSFWTVWNEPNFGEDLGPEATKGSSIDVAPMYYRNLVAAAWSALQRTGHAGDTVLIGGLSAQGLRSRPWKGNPAGWPGNFAQMKPLEFIRHLYCLDNHLHPMRGQIARAEGCPTSPAGTRSFRAHNPGLFNATGFAQHPYEWHLSPVQGPRHDPDNATFHELPRMWRFLGRVLGVYGSHRHYRIYNDEYGYITSPPNTGHYVSPKTAAMYINWAEYLSWKTPWIASYTQYPLSDPSGPNLPETGGFSSGLETPRGRKKPAFDAYRMPLFLPVTSARSGVSLELWGDVRPAHYAQSDTGAAQVVQIQYQPGSRGSFTTIKSLTITDARGYFDLRLKFPASGSVRLAWTYPSTDPFLPSGALGVTVYSRTQTITIS